MTMPEAQARPEATRRDAEPVAIRLHAPLPERIRTGRGQFLVVYGECTTADRGINELRVVFNGRESAAELSPIPGGVGFWQAVLAGPELNGTSAAVDIRVTLDDGRVVTSNLGRCHCQDIDRDPVAVPDRLAAPDLVAICMATYRPEPAAFRRQIDSIRAQTHERWICIVQDDGTPEGDWTRMRRYCEGDERFVFLQNPRNLGFYRNFERVLTRVPEGAAYVAFADQDDAWYPDKLALLVERLESTDAQLVYSDMRIVAPDGTELAATYWTNRKNEYKDLQVVLVANTVTGAASLFRGGILEYLLPFPPRVGDAFHDHWLACVAMSTGRLEYIDRPLYDYYQYGASVIGHCDFVRFSMMQRVKSLVRFCYRMCRPAVARPLLRQKYASALAVYRGECRRLRLVENTIRTRCPLAPRRARQLRLFDGGLRSMARLLVLHAKVLVKGQTTDDAELRLAMGELARSVERGRRGSR